MWSSAGFQCKFTFRFCNLSRINFSGMYLHREHHENRDHHSKAVHDRKPACDLHFESLETRFSSPDMEPSAQALSTTSKLFLPLMISSLTFRLKSQIRRKTVLLKIWSSKCSAYLDHISITLMKTSRGNSTLCSAQPTQPTLLLLGKKKHETKLL